MKIRKKSVHNRKDWALANKITHCACPHIYRNVHRTDGTISMADTATSRAQTTTRMSGTAIVSCNPRPAYSHRDVGRNHLPRHGHNDNTYTGHNRYSWLRWLWNECSRGRIRMSRADFCPPVQKKSNKCNNSCIGFVKSLSKKKKLLILQFKKSWKHNFFKKYTILNKIKKTIGLFSFLLVSLWIVTTYLQQKKII